MGKLTSTDVTVFIALVFGNIFYLWEYQDLLGLVGLAFVIGYYVRKSIKGEKLVSSEDQNVPMDEPDSPQVKSVKLTV